MSDVEVFYGVASGQQRSALSRLDPEGVMISHATQNNQPIDGDHELFIDCGGYHHMVSGAGEYGDTDDEYIEYLLDVAPDWFALRDYPCEPDLLEQLGRTVRDQQHKTTENHISVYNAATDAGIVDDAVAVVQGWTTDHYLRHLDDLRDHGLLTDRMAIGSVCRRNADKDIANVVRAVRGALPAKCELHAFGVKGSVLRFEEVVDALDSVDSAAYDYSATRFKDETAGDGYNSWRDTARAYLNWRHELAMNMATETLDGRGSTQATFNEGGIQQSSATPDYPSDHERTCLCGTVIPPYGQHEDFEPGCRHCQRTALNYWDRAVALDDP